MPFAVASHGGAADSAGSALPQHQQASRLTSAQHMCFEDSSKDVLVLLSDCGTTYDSVKH